jgi:hypothetical protein
MVNVFQVIVDFTVNVISDILAIDANVSDTCLVTFLYSMLYSICM